MKKEDLKLAIYQLENGEIEVNFDKNEETFWLDVYQIGSLFGRDRSVIQKHIKNIYETGELEEKTTCAKNAQVQLEGNRKVKRENNLYNLDMIISVGYRVNSKIATNFRKWATGVLKEHITTGFTINKNQIQRNYDRFLKVVEDLKKLTIGKEIGNDEVLNLIKSFANTWFNLENFDKGNLPEKGITKKEFKIEIKKLYQDIEILKQDLIKKGLATEMFAQEKNRGNLEGIFGNIFASFDGVDLYETIEEKASNLLYFVIKNHPFNDGNKRTGAFCFVWFLQKTGFEFSSIISPETLTTLTLLIAQSDPKEKERMIGLILLLLKK
ncbi:virulence protein RhuM/Fic/DOC family protein [Candidatus Gracilibacteria bacterium]|nr:virulence protein RhuM/Fic/DOC family protein [Candidatus Gracilibacteria bacterium]